MTYHEYTTRTGKTIRRHYNGIRTAGLQTLDLEAPRPESAYDHISPDLLSELKYRWGIGQTHEYLSSIPQEQWDQVDDLVRAELRPKKEELEVAASSSETTSNPRTEKEIVPSIVTYESLTREVIEKWGIDSRRAGRALDIVQYHGETKVLLARKDENGNPIIPTENLYIVRASKGRDWYYVRPKQKTCTCYDSQRGSVCKHRIAVWLFNEIRNRHILAINPNFFAQQEVEIEF